MTATLRRTGLPPWGIAALGVLVIIGTAAAWLRSGATLAAWLAVWWWCAGIVMGGLANVWLHDLTGGEWGEVLRADALALGRGMGWLAMLFLPVLAGMTALYPWAGDAAAGTARWSGELALDSAGFKSRWLVPWAFVARSVGYLVLWVVLGWLAGRPGLARRKGFAAFALMAYGLSVSLAAVDWLMSLMPLWYSSVFGLLAGTGQMMSGLAFGVVRQTWATGFLPSPAGGRGAGVRASAPGTRDRAIVRSYPHPQPLSHEWERGAVPHPQLPFERDAVLHPQLLRDFGNLLLTYLLTWAYLSFTQYLIIWSANLPHEIVWYVARREGGWQALAWLLAACQFVLPLLALLSRAAKQSPAILGTLAAVLLGSQLLAACWMVLPSLGLPPVTWWWRVPLVTLAFGLAAAALAMALLRNVEARHG